MFNHIKVIFPLVFLLDVGLSFATTAEVYGTRKQGLVLNAAQRMKRTTTLMILITKITKILIMKMTRIFELGVK